MATLDLFKASHLKERKHFICTLVACCTLTVPDSGGWGDTALTASRGLQESLWLTIHGLGDIAKFF